MSTKYTRQFMRDFAKQGYMLTCTEKEWADHGKLNFRAGVLVGGSIMLFIVFLWGLQ